MQLMQYRENGIKNYGIYVMIIILTHKFAYKYDEMYITYLQMYLTSQFM